MIAQDEDALICDLAETYKIYNYKAFSPVYIGTLAAGLRDDSRIKLKLSGMTIPISQFLAAFTADKLANLVWMQSKDGHKGRNAPESLLAKLMRKDAKNKKQTADIKAFDTPEEFEAAMAKYQR